MIEIHAIIKEVSQTEKRVHGSLDVKINSQNPTKEEITIAARIISKLREIGIEIGKEENAKVKMVETKVKLQPDQPNGDSETGKT